ncbi:hypothetical protein ACRDNQ_02265 [Palleronia sp. KMU-117]|uniref:hypothetical protein n=1 Tax=Palleronia sp. KMU-117 TaxID=3434108 RepID=UPI003D7462D7
MLPQPSKVGRPRSYTTAQLSDVLTIVRKDGSEPTVDAVRDVLCSQFEVPRTVRAETLAREIAVQIAEQDRQPAELCAAENARSEIMQEFTRIVGALKRDDAATSLTPRG